MKSRSIRHLLSGAAVSAFALVCGTAQAQVGTGSLTGWSVLGDAVASNGTLTLTSAYLDGAGDQAGNLSGNSAVDVAEVEMAAGIAPFGLDLPPDHAATEGSIVRQSFMAMAGQSLGFDWSFTSQEALYLDHAFVVIDGRLFTLATTAQRGTGVQSFAYGITQSGQVTLAFGVVDTDDVNGVSSLEIGNLRLGAVAAPVPEPSTWAILGAGLGVLVWFARRSAPLSDANPPDRARARPRIRS